MVLSFLVLMGLSGITIRSNLISVFSSQQRQQTQGSQFSAASTSTHTLPSERRIELANMEEVREEGSTSSHNQEADPVQSSEDAELGKWKAVELFKVLNLSLFPILSMHPDCSSDNSELSAGHSHSCGNRCSVDIRTDRTLPDCR